MTKRRRQPTGRDNEQNPDKSFDDEDLYHPIEVRGEDKPALTSTQRTIEWAAKKYFKFCRKIARTINRFKRNRSD